MRNWRVTINELVTINSIISYLYEHIQKYLNDENTEKRERAQLWRTSIGLQAVDNLCVSNFLVEIARKHIEGEISMDEVSRMIDEHYRKPKEP